MFETISRSSQVPHLPPLTPNSSSIVKADSTSRGRGGGVGWQSNELGELERRISTLEQSHRLLLEELVRMQADSKAWLIHQQDGWRERDREVRSMRESFGASSSMMGELEHRITEKERRATDKMDHLSRSVEELQTMIKTWHHQSSEERERVGMVTERLQEAVEQLVKHQAHMEEEVERQGESMSAGMSRMKQLTGRQEEMGTAVSSLRELVQSLEGGQQSLVSEGGR